MRTALILAAAAVVVATGWVHGRWTNRWGATRELEEAVARLERIPLVIGEWRGERQEMSHQEVELAEADGAVVRRYKNRKGDDLAVLLICGRPGPISTHTPDICYVAAGYTPASTPIRLAVPLGPPGEAAELLAARFLKTGEIVPTSLGICWGWSDGGGWKAPSSPRLTYATSPVLYKLYVVRGVESIDTPWEGDPSAGFIAQLLPELDRALFRGRRQDGPVASAGR